MKVLIAEDEKISRKALMKSISDVGDCTIADNGKDAIRLFDQAYAKKAPFDLVFLDISMPDINGMQALNIIRQKESSRNISRSDRLKIIMISTSMRKADIKKCIKLGCDSYLCKPFKKQKLYKELIRLGFDIPDELIADVDGSNSYTELVAKIIRRFNSGEFTLPVLTHMVQEVQSLLEKSEPSIEDLATIVEKDAVISTKLISVANSPLYQGVELIKNLKTALQRLGLQEAMSIITTITNKNLFHSENKPLNKYLNTLWTHSLACACCAKYIAEEIHDKGLQSIFLMGIIHDIGKLFLIKAIVEISPEKPIENSDLQAAIMEVHTFFGAMLIKKWNFPTNFIPVVKNHHWEKFPGDAGKEVLIIHTADLLVTEIGYGSQQTDSQHGSNNKTDKALSNLFRQLGIDPDRIKVIRDMVLDSMKSLTDLF
ncbi:MAG: HDOD domain-containing protein [Proteobacteria bacterium]|nr:HDOD domain-containing protein [Pseudomonadota bacterium]MBU1581998.1 HDOD domain-containing protein [Pseudomonadota bacterium]MBU2452427.1 HDOD domain-containing protein [Pseudomonadota bacterium]MBU2630528.1 HDOD domain-containing protein [Pseudomonadota bacterium]